MRTAIAMILATAALGGLAGCESSAETSSARMLRYQVDDSRQRSVWLTREGVLIHSAAKSSQAVPLPDWLWAGAPHCPPDLALGPDGEAVITSNVLPTVWKVDPVTFAVTVHALALNTDVEKDVGFAAIVYSAEQGAFIAYSETQHSLWRIDRDLKTAVKIGRAEFNRPRPGKVRFTPCANLAWRLNLGE